MDDEAFQPPQTRDPVGNGLAIASYLTIPLGIPLFVVPLFLKADRDSVQHARQAAVIYVGFTVTFVFLFFLFFCTFGLTGILMPLALAWLIPCFAGVVMAMQEGSEDMPLIGPVARAALGFLGDAEEG